MKTWDGWHEGLAGRAKTIAGLIPRVGGNLVGLHHCLILVTPELNESTIFSVSVTKPNRSQYNIQNKGCLNCARDQRKWISNILWHLNLNLEMTDESSGISKRQRRKDELWTRILVKMHMRMLFQQESFERHYRRRYRRLYQGRYWGCYQRC